MVQVKVGNEKHVNFLWIYVVEERERCQRGFRGMDSTIQKDLFVFAF